MPIDYEKVHQIITSARRDYYAKDAVPCQRHGPLAPHIDEVFQRVCRPQSRVLDIGCGNGRTLLRNAQRFLGGVGLDNDHQHLALAQANLQQSGVTNVRFLEARGDNLALRLEAESFDFVYSERGPLPGADVNTRNAVRVLKKGGVLFAENPGPLTNYETGYIFDRLFEPLRPAELTANLQNLAAEFERNGIEVQLSCSWTEKLVFPDFYAWLGYHFSGWDYYPQWRLDTWPLPQNILHGIDRFLCMTMDEQGRIRITHQRFWTGGIKRLGGGQLAPPELPAIAAGRLAVGLLERGAEM